MGRCSHRRVVGWEIGMNPLVLECVGGAARVLIPLAAVYGISISDADIDAVVKASIVIGTIGWSIWRKVKRARYA